MFVREKVQAIKQVDCQILKTEERLLSISALSFIIFKHSSFIFCTTSNIEKFVKFTYARRCLRVIVVTLQKQTFFK